MQIQEIVIHKYGCLQNKYYCLNPEWQVFYGDNESGKTTLCSFIISILYGFKQGKNYGLSPGDGGYLIVKVDNQLYKIERYYRKWQNKSQISSLDDDYIGSDDFLQKNILKNILPKDFKYIFLLSLDKLNFSQELTVSSWQELALSYAMSGSDKLYKLQNQYKQELSMLYNAKHQTGKIVDLIQQLTELQSTDKLVNNLSDNLKYRSYLNEIQTLEDQKAQLEAKLSNLTSKFSKNLKGYNNIGFILIIALIIGILALKWPILWLILLLMILLFKYFNKKIALSAKTTNVDDLQVRKLRIKIQELTEQINELKATQRLEDLKRMQNKQKINQVQIMDHQKDKLLQDLKMNMQKFQKLQLKLNWLQDIKEGQRLTILPAVIQKASIYFNFLTQNKYQSINIENNQLVVITNKQRYQVQELSFSAKSQLLLCLKLAFIDYQEYKMPIIIDDAWQMYDNKRRTQLYRLLRTLNYQVISMTSDEMVLQYNQEIRI